MNKKIMILIIFFVSLLAVSAVCAADNATSDVASVDSTIDDAIIVENNGADDMVGANDTVNVAENENDVLGSSINNDVLTNTVDEKLALEYSSEVSDVSNDTNVIENNKEILQVENSKTIYVNSSSGSGGDGSEASPFQNLQDAVNAATNGDTIMIASGEYKGAKNTHNLVIRKNLNFIKYGDGEAIFNGENQKRIWFIGGSSTNRLYLNIRGLTFINGKSTGDAGAIYFNYAGGSITDCTFTKF